MWTIFGKKEKERSGSAPPASARELDSGAPPLVRSKSSEGIASTSAAAVFWDIQNVKDIIDTTDIRADDINQCVMDWTRDLNDTYINSVSIGEIYIQAGYAVRGVDGKIVLTGDITPDILKNIWQQYILKDFDKEKRAVMLGHLQKYMHQGGYMHMLQAALCQAGVKENITILANSCVNKRFSIITLRNEIYLIEQFDVRSIYIEGMRGSEDFRGDGIVGVDKDGRIVRKDGAPLMSGMGRYVLTMDEKGPKLSIRNANFEYHCAYANALFRNLQAKKEPLDEGKRQSSTLPP